jgi:hypothetical protein
MVIDQQSDYLFASDTNPTHLIEINTPNPYPARGIYGFVLYLLGWALFVAFLGWAFIPTPLLQRVYITYVPSKYWAVFGPALIPIFTTVFVIFNCVWNAWNFRGFFQDIAYVENDFGD